MTTIHLLTTLWCHLILLQGKARPSPAIHVPSAPCCQSSFSMDDLRDSDLQRRSGFQKTAPPSTESVSFPLQKLSIKPYGTTFSNKNSHFWRCVKLFLDPPSQWLLSVNTSVKPLNWKVGCGDVSVTGGSVVCRAPCDTSNAPYPLPSAHNSPAPPTGEAFSILNRFYLPLSPSPGLLLSHIGILFLVSLFSNCLGEVRQTTIPTRTRQADSFVSG